MWKQHKTNFFQIRERSLNGEPRVRLRLAPMPWKPSVSSVSSCSHLNRSGPGRGAGADLFSNCMVTAEVGQQSLMTNRSGILPARCTSLMFFSFPHAVSARRQHSILRIHYFFNPSVTSYSNVLEKAHACFAFSKAALPKNPPPCVIGS